VTVSEEGLLHGVNLFVNVEAFGGKQASRVLPGTFCLLTREIYKPERQRIYRNIYFMRGELIRWFLELVLNLALLANMKPKVS